MIEMLIIGAGGAVIAGLVSRVRLGKARGPRFVAVPVAPGGATAETVATDSLRMMSRALAKDGFVMPPAPVAVPAAKQGSTTGVKVR